MNLLLRSRNRLILALCALAASAGAAHAASPHHEFAPPDDDTPLRIRATPALGFGFSPGYQPFALEYREASESPVDGMTVGGNRVAVVPAVWFDAGPARSYPSWSVGIELPVTLFSGHERGEVFNAWNAPGASRRFLDAHISGVGIGLRATLALHLHQRLAVRLGLGRERLAVDYDVGEGYQTERREAATGSFALDRMDLRLGAALRLGAHLELVAALGSTGYKTSEVVPRTHVIDRVDTDEGPYTSLLEITPDRETYVELGLVIRLPRD